MRGPIARVTPVSGPQRGARARRWIDGVGALWLVVGAGFVARLVHLADLSRLPLFARPTADSALYLEAARTWASGELPPVCFKPPLYPFVLSIAWPKGPQPETLSYTQLIEAVEAGRVRTLTIVAGEAVHGTWRSSPPDPRGEPDFTTVYPVETAEALVQAATTAGVEVGFMRPPDRAFYRQVAAFAVQFVLLGVLGWMLFLNLRGQGGNGKQKRK